MVAALESIQQTRRVLNGVDFFQETRSNPPIYKIHTKYPNVTLRKQPRLQPDATVRNNQDFNLQYKK